MKPLSLLLVGSLLANGALALVLWSRAAHLTAPAAANPVAGVAIAPKSAPVATPSLDPEMGQKLEIAEPADFVAQLRAQGFPPSIIRALVRERVRQHFLPRYQAIAEAEARKPFWRREGFYDPKITAERRALGRESDALMQQLLGPDALQPTADQLAALQHRFGSLPVAKLMQLQRLVADYNDLNKEVSDLGNGILLPEDRTMLAVMQKERDADLAKLLSPEELLEYELHHSSTANRLLAQLRAFDPNEKEFRALFVLNRAIDAEYGNPGVLAPEERRARAAAQKQLGTQIETALGPERFAAYQQATDPAYQQVYQIVTRLELPVSTAAQVVAVQKDIEQRLAAVRTNSLYSPEQRQAEFAALNQEALAKLNSSLGAAGLEAYKSTGVPWLNQLQRAATSKAAPKQP